MAPDQHPATDATSGGRRPAPPTGLAAVLATARSGSSGALRGRRLIGLVLLVYMPVVVQTIILIWGKGRGSAFNSFAEVVTNAYLRVILPLTVIFLGTGAFGDEWEGGTACYLVGAPMRRRLIVTGRWLAATCRGLLLALPAIVLVYALSLVRFEGALANYLGDLAWVLLAVSLVIMGYSAVFAFLGLTLRRSVMTSLIVVLIFEGLVGNLPRLFAIFSLGYHARSLLYETTGHKAFEPPRFGMDEVQSTPAPISVAVMLLVVVIFIALATWALRRKQFTGDAQTEGASG
ncbi:MAG: ABC transporter permease [Planctomycetota bacterium]|jgi:ABC-2 type transport system permease protein